MTGPGRIVVVGNEKGGTGKSTTAMHIAIGLLLNGSRVAVVDLDLRQQSLGRFVDNRLAHAANLGIQLPMPRVERITDPDCGETGLGQILDRACELNDVVVVDTPGHDQPLGRIGHSFADVLVTPLNDSLIDLDVLARVDAGTMTVQGPSHYAETVWQQKLKRAGRDGGSIDWVVMRNRLGHLEARNMREMERLLSQLSKRIGFRVVPGFGERVVFRELFLKGLTVMDLHRMGADGLSMSHVSARQEVRGLIQSLRLS